ncbi:MAG: tRNA pseudouridine(55) synthase TruB [Patulibacter sp.]|nr:tRNA pseudouridine(55) synthase TruB [Patulibacter sp.]
MSDVPSVPDGAVLIDKPAGASSHDIVHRIRRQLGGRKARRVGHTGTLDPFATGLLIVLIGRATRIQQHLMGLDKSYETLARLGARSTTGDTEGEVTVTGAFPADPPDLPTGLIRQRPPAYSAVKIDGQRAYARARRGEDVEMPEREVTVHRFEQLSRDDDRARYAIECSSGTYVRSLIGDLGDGYCLELRRTAIGPFTVEQAQSPEDPPDAWRIVPLLDLLRVVMPIVPIGAEIARRATHGQRFALDAAPATGTFALVHDDEPIAIAEREPDGRTHPVVGFRT